MSDSNIFDIIACSNCKGPITMNSGILKCNFCGTEFGLIDGSIPVMLSDKSNLFSESSRTVKEKVKNIYRNMSRYYEEKKMSKAIVFLNQGYVPNDNKQYAVITTEHILLNKNCVKMLLEVIGNVDLNDLKICDIGCGKGGNITNISKYFNPSLILGIDISIENIKFCVKNSKNNKNVFCVGDAEALPFKRDFFDVILNIESSYNYPDKYLFYKEVAKVLKMQGYFLYADFFDTSELAHMEEFLFKSGFSILRNQDITSNVILSIDKSAKNNEHFMREFYDSLDKESLNRITAGPGSTFYNDMKNGKKQYKILCLKKTKDKYSL